MQTFMTPKYIRNSYPVQLHFSIHESLILLSFNLFASSVSARTLLWASLDWKTYDWDFLWGSSWSKVKKMV
jgi:hypothetical protein